MERILILYDLADETYYKELKKHLSTIDAVLMTEPLAGDNIQTHIETQIADADAIILLLSADFLANDFLQPLAEQALLKYHLRKNMTCSVLVRHCHFTDSAAAAAWILPPSGEFAPTSNRDSWWLTVISQLQILLKLATLQAQLGAKDSEIAMLRDKIKQYNH